MWTPRADEAPVDEMRGLVRRHRCWADAFLHIPRAALLDHAEAAGVRRGRDPYGRDDLHPSVPPVLGCARRAGRRADQLLPERGEVLEHGHQRAAAVPGRSPAPLQPSGPVRHQPWKPHR